MTSNPEKDKEFTDKHPQAEHAEIVTEMKKSSQENVDPA